MTNSAKKLSQNLDLDELDENVDEHITEFALLQDIAFKHFLDSCPYPVWCKDYTTGEGTMIFISSMYEKVFHIPSAEYLKNTDYDVWPEEYADVFKKNDLAAINANKIIKVKEAVIGRLAISKKWRTCDVYKWATRPDVFGYKFTLVFGMAMPAGADGQ